jgi:hypothetical protein
MKLIRKLKLRIIKEIIEIVREEELLFRFKERRLVELINRELVRELVNLEQDSKFFRFLAS